MDRQIVYTGQIPRSADILKLQTQAMVNDGYIGAAILGSTPIVSGLGVTYGAPANLTLSFGPGVISYPTTVDATAFGAQAADSNSLLKFGLNVTSSLTFAPPATSGQSLIAIVYAQFTETDANGVVLNFYDPSNPTLQFVGPNGSGLQSNTTRQQRCLLNFVAGAPATTGSQVAPAIPSGTVALYSVLLTYGQTAITAQNVTQVTSSPWINYNLLQLQNVPAEIAALQAASNGSQQALGYTPANAAGDVSGNATFPTVSGKTPVVTIGSNAAGTVNAAMINSTTFAGTNLMLSGPMTTGGAVTMNGGLVTINNATGNMTTSSSTDTTLDLISSSGGDVALGLTSAGKYGVKLGLLSSASGMFAIGGVSDGAGVYRLKLDQYGNLNLTSTITPPAGVNSNTLTASKVITGTLNASGAATINGAMLTLGDFYCQSLASGNDRHLWYRDHNGNNQGVIYQNDTNGYLAFSANGDGTKGFTLDRLGNISTSAGVSAASINTPALGATSATFTNVTTTGTVNANAGLAVANSVLSVTNGLSNLNTAGGDATFAVANAGGGEASLSFESRGNYGLKMGINSIGSLYVGGWTDGASSYRLVGDRLGNWTTNMPNGSVQFPSLASTGGTVCLGSSVANAGSAGQVSYGVVNGYNCTQLFAKTGSLYVRTDGAVYCANGVQSTALIASAPSASILKENVVPHKDALATITALPVIDFNYKPGTGMDTDKRHTGFMAEDVQRLIPQAYVEASAVHDGHGNKLSDGYGGVDYSRIVPSIVRSAQQLAGWNNVLEAKLKDQTAYSAALEARLAALEAKLSS